MNKDEKYSSLMLHAVEGNPEALSLQLNQKGIEKQLEIQNAKGHTALALAVKAGQFECAELLINKGADVNALNKVILASKTIKGKIIRSLPCSLRRPLRHLRIPAKHRKNKDRLSGHQGLDSTDDGSSTRVHRNS